MRTQQSQVLITKFYVLFSCGSDIELLEKVQKRATKLIPTIKTMTYTERLKACKLPTLHYSHIRGDMIEMYKILSGKYDTAVIPRVNREYSSITRGNNLRLQKN